METTLSKRRLHKRRIVATSLIGVALTAAVAPRRCRRGARPAARGTDERSKRPNIVVVMTDDQRLDEMGFMPKTRKLIGKRGTTFENEVVSYSLCCPSRSTYVTGQYAHNHGVTDNVPPWGGYSQFDFRNALGVWMQDAGYTTAHIGKQLNGYGSDGQYGSVGSDAPVPPGYDDWFATIDPSTYQMYGFSVQDNDWRVDYPATEAVENYQATVLGDRAVADIERFAPRHKPFFLTVAPSSPHFEVSNPYGGPRAAPADEGLYAGLEVEPDPSFDEENVSDKPSVITRWPRLTDEDKATIEQRARDRAEAIKSIDDMVGRIVDALRDSGQLDNTVIMFTSDNGYMMGEHRMFGEKVVPYEPSIRVPLLVRGPGFPAGAHRKQLVSNIDFAPTITALAGADAGLKMDGESLLPFARDPKHRKNRVIGLEAAFHEITGPLVQLIPKYADYNVFFDGVRTPRFMAADYYRDVDGNLASEDELYDLVKDPHQMKSVHARPRYAETHDDLLRLTRKLKRCDGKECRLSYPDGSARNSAQE